MLVLTALLCYIVGLPTCAVITLSRAGTYAALLPSYAALLLTYVALSLTCAILTSNGHGT